MAATGDEIESRRARRENAPQFSLAKSVFVFVSSEHLSKDRSIEQKLTNETLYFRNCGKTRNSKTFRKLLQLSFKYGIVDLN